MNVHYATTNFLSWDALQFFTNAADVMLRSLATNDPGVYPTNLSVTNILIYPTNYYTPSVHRLIQLAANMYDATTNSFTNGFNPASMPTARCFASRSPITASFN